MNAFFAFGASLLLVTVVYGCVPPQEHARSVSEANATRDNLTVGKVQREIRIGMTNGEVIEVLGSPNMVATDSERREVWTYDKVATFNVYSHSQGGVNTLLLGGAPVGAGIAGGAIGGEASYSSGASASSQKTLTIIIKFDNAGRVRDFSYRQSSF